MFACVTWSTSIYVYYTTDLFECFRYKNECLVQIKIYRKLNMLVKPLIDKLLIDNNKDSKVP